jgi:hypothetical protein
MNDLRDVKVGDPIAVVFYSSRTSCVRSTVAKVTLTQVTLADGSRWLRRGGKKVGGAGSYSYSHLSAEPWDESRHPQMQQEAEREMLANKLSHWRFDRLTYDQLQRVIAICLEA